MRTFHNLSLGESDSPARTLLYYLAEYLLENVLAKISNCLEQIMTVQTRRVGFVCIGRRISQQHCKNRRD